jgi:hypothetical protein
MFLQINPESLSSHLSSQQNLNSIKQFANDFEVRFMILQKSKDGKVIVELDWGAEMLTSCNTLLIKKNNFAFVKDISAFKIS